MSFNSIFLKELFHWVLSYEYNFHSIRLILGLSDLSPSGLSNIIRRIEQLVISILKSFGNCPLLMEIVSIK